MLRDAERRRLGWYLVSKLKHARVDVQSTQSTSGLCLAFFALSLTCDFIYLCTTWWEARDLADADEVAHLSIWV